MKKKYLLYGFGTHINVGWQTCILCIVSIHHILSLKVDKHIVLLVIVRLLSMSPGNYTCEVEWAGDPIRVTHSLVVLQPPTINKPLIGEMIYIQQHFELTNYLIS